jgi:DNA-binding Lrp family transcriptional regulator
MDVDETDRKILYLLEKETSTTLTHDDIANRIDVSSSTVTNRLQRLRDDEILKGVHPQLDYERAGVPFHVLFVCTVPIEKRKELQKRRSI